jgi:uncharacterized protein involved in exopolysaccharide biosynthesis
MRTDQDAAAPSADSGYGVGEALAGVRARWWMIPLGVALGLAAAAAVVAWAPRSFEGTSTVLVRSAPDLGSSLLTRLGVPAEFAPSGLGAGRSAIETEMQVLSSRSVLGAVADSLGLQVRVRSPRGIAPWMIVEPARYPGSFRRIRLRFERLAPDRYRVTGGPGDSVVVPGVPFSAAPGVRATLRRDALPTAFTIDILDREDALRRADKALSVSKAGGEVIRVTFRAPDSLTAAAVPNALSARYLALRRSIDRGTNTRRYEFLVAQSDSVADQLREAENGLRARQEATGLFDPQLAGKTALEGAVAIRQRIGALDVEAVGLGQILDRVRRGAATPRQLAAYPALLQSAAVNDIVTQIAELETERIKRLELRTERDPSVKALDSAIRNLEQQIEPLASAYGATLARQRSELLEQLRPFERALASLPGGAQATGRLDRDVRRLGQTALALQAQLVEARLAAIGEGGDVRQLDVAEPTKRPVFPRPTVTFAVGGVGGLVLGVALAVIAGVLVPTVARAGDVARAAGVSAIAWDRRGPVVVGGGETLLLVPIGSGADTSGVLRATVRPSTGGGVHSTLDLAGQATDVDEARRALGALESTGAAPVVACPPLDDGRTAAVLSTNRAVLFVARAGGVRRAQVTAATDALRRLDVPCAGIVVHADLNGA